jgi:hypothetical protein
MPHWYGHGSVFVYDGRYDHWAEINMRAGQVIHHWQRQLEEHYLAKDVFFNENHPRDGVFTAPKWFWGADQIKVQNSIVHVSFPFTAQKLVLPGVCIVQHGSHPDHYYSVFIYHVKEDSWVEIQLEHGEKAVAKVIRHYKRGVEKGICCCR